MSDPKFCWTCGSKLQLDKQGKLIFRMLPDPIGNEHRVHVECSKQLYEKREAQDIEFYSSLERAAHATPTDLNDKEYL